MKDKISVTLDSIRQRFRSSDTVILCFATIAAAFAVTGLLSTEWIQTRRTATIPSVTYYIRSGLWTQCIESQYWVLLVGSVLTEQCGDVPEQGPWLHAVRALCYIGTIFNLMIFVALVVQKNKENVLRNIGCLLAFMCLSSGTCLAAALTVFVTRHSGKMSVYHIIKHGLIGWPTPSDMNVQFLMAFRLVALSSILISVAFVMLCSQNKHRLDEFATLVCAQCCSSSYDKSRYDNEHKENKQPKSRQKRNKPKRGKR